LLGMSSILTDSERCGIKPETVQRDIWPPLTWREFPIWIRYGADSTSMYSWGERDRTCSTSFLPGAVKADGVEWN